MALLSHVQPGQVIRSRDFNAVIDEINTLSAGGAPGVGVPVPDVFGLQLGQARTTITQPSVNLTLGAALDVFGTVIDPNAAGSAARVVIGQAPPAATRVPVGSPVNLTLSSQAGTSVPIGGQVDVTFDSATPATPVAGSAITFRYGITSRANQAGTFTIVPTIGVASNQTQWQNALQVLDDANQPLSGSGLTLAANETRFVRVQITSVPSSPANAPFTITVSAVLPGVVAHPDTRGFTVGTASPPQDTTIDVFDIINAVPNSALTGSTVTLAAGAQVRVNCRVHFTVAGTYDVTAAITSGTNWTAERNTGSTPATYTINPGDLNTPAATQNPEFMIRANVGASATGVAELRIQRQGQTPLRSRVLTLQRNP
jgi:PASTA domain-containing protein